LLQLIFKLWRRVLKNNLTDRNLRVARGEDVLGTVLIPAARKEGVLDLAGQAFLLQHPFKRAQYLIDRISGFGRRSVERRRVFANLVNDLLVFEPNEVIEDAGNARLYGFPQSRRRGISAPQNSENKRKRQQ